MRKLRVTERRGPEFSIRYPTKTADAKRILAGAKSGNRLTQEERAEIPYKRVAAGGACTDMPKCLQAASIANGNIEVVKTKKRGGD